MDAQERQFLGGSLSESSGNVDAHGNFSIQVITNALSNIDIDLTVWNMKIADNRDPSLEIGFIVNRDAHWFSIRKIHNKWWDLNSAKETPEYISDFYLGAFLSQLSNDGYSVFVARGNFPQDSECHSNETEGPFWHLESELTKNNSAIVVEKFSGKGNKLGGDGDGDGAGEKVGSDFMDEEEGELARAIALSVADITSAPTMNNIKNGDADGHTDAPHMTEKEKIRAKRLAAMGR